MGRRRFDTAPDCIPIGIYVHQTGSTCHVTALCPNSDDSCARARRRATTAAAGRLRARSAPHPETVPLEGCRTALQSAWRGPAWARFFGAPAVDGAGGGLALPPGGVLGGGAAPRRRVRGSRGRVGAPSGCLPGFRQGRLARLTRLGGAARGLLDWAFTRLWSREAAVVERLFGGPATGPGGEHWRVFWRARPAGRRQHGASWRAR